MACFVSHCPVFVATQQVADRSIALEGDDCRRWCPIGVADAPMYYLLPHKLCGTTAVERSRRGSESQSQTSLELI